MNDTQSVVSPRVVVGVDGSPQSKQALRWAARLAIALGARLEAVTAWDLPTSVGWLTVSSQWDPAPDVQKSLTSAVDEVFGTQRPVDMQLFVHKGGIVRVLLDQAEGALLLVVGSSGLGGFSAPRSGLSPQIGDPNDPPMTTTRRPCDHYGHRARSSTSVCRLGVAEEEYSPTP